MTKDWDFLSFFFLQNCFNIKLLIIMFIRMCDVQYLKKKKLKMLITWDDLSFINTTQKFLKPFKKNGSIPRMDEKKLHTWGFQLKGIGRNIRCKLLEPPSPPPQQNCSQNLCE